MFKINQITVRNHYGTDFSAVVNVEMDAKEWTKLKNKSALGQLYGIDISNEVSRLTNKAIKAYYPTVKDDTRASKGTKQITLYYKMSEAEILNLGLSKYFAYEVIYQVGVAKLRCVKAG